MLQKNLIVNARARLEPFDKVRRKCDMILQQLGGLRRRRCGAKRTQLDV
jgi:hypothetical protein